MHQFFPVELDLSNPDHIVKLKLFLERFDLKMDTVDAAFVIIEDYKIIASCCKLKNVFKMIAVDQDYQHNNLVALLLSEVNYLAFQQGYTHTFTFTPIVSQPIFKSLGYTLVAQTSEVALLEKGVMLINDVIALINKTYDCQQTNNGAIIINGNPFSLGHQYLIETASQQVERLFVFVVEEDASFFSFEERIELIKLGTQHLDNVVVLPSTQYIISQATFPNYFVRDKDHGFDMYATLDATLFGTWFSKLNITVRFVGEEPLDPMTDAYNQTMLNILPHFNIKLEIIKRKKNKFGIISASRIRTLLKYQDWETLEAYVPKTTFDYIKNNQDIVEKMKHYDGKH